MKLTPSALPKEVQDLYKKSKDFHNIEKVELQHSGIGDVYYVRLFNGMKEKWTLDGKNWVGYIINYPVDGNAD